MTEEKEMKTYHVEFKNGNEKRIIVPADWKVTFGPCVAGRNNGPNKFEMPMALRFYEPPGKENQRAIFIDVASFRDMSIEITEKKVVEQEEIGYVERQGKRKATTFRATTAEWINPDEDEDPELLPAPPEPDMVKSSAFDLIDTKKEVIN